MENSLLTRIQIRELISSEWLCNKSNAVTFIRRNIQTSPDELCKLFQDVVARSEKEPLKLKIFGWDNDWIYKGIQYATDGPYTDDQFKLLIYEEFDKERRMFERHKKKFESPESVEASRSRPRFPESVRIEVWRRDSGKCAKCGSRENLGYEHIVPVSKGGSNTARNIDLLCEKRNRSKGSNIV